MSELKTVMDKIYTLDMFSKEGWEEVRKKCGGVREMNDRGSATDAYLADAFIDFQVIWCDDNFVDYWEDFNDNQRTALDAILLTRYSDYLLHD